jgi:hypothetical protein
MAKRSKKQIFTIQIPQTMRSPLRESEEASIGSDAEHAFFLRCFDLYRLIELVDRSLESMIEAYSKYRTRDLFKETLKPSHFDMSEEGLQGLDPNLNATVQAMFNRIHELRVSLLFEDALPFTVKARIETVLADLKHEWNSMQDRIESRYRWKFKTF